MGDLQQSTYLNIMLDTLSKKKHVLEQIGAATNEQTRILTSEEFNVDEFDRLIEVKDDLINKLNTLDDGFLNLYNRVKDEISNNPDLYGTEIIEAQNYIRDITEMSTSVQVAEERNKGHLEIQLAKGRQKVKDFKVGSRTAIAYYKNLAGRHQEGDSYFFNKKK